LGAIYDPFAALLKGRATEVDEQAERQVGRAKISEDPFRVAGSEILNGLQFREHHILDV
jgi:hypothetical protein